MPNHVWTIVEHRGPNGLAAVEADWRRLYDQMADPTAWHSHEVFSAYVEHLCPAPEDFRCLALSDGETIRAILPIEERNEPGFGVPLRVWAMPWGPNDAISLQDDACEVLLPAAVEHLRRQPGRPGILVVGRTWDGSALWKGLGDLATSTWFAFADGAEYVIPTNMTTDEFWSRLSKNSRKALRRAARMFDALEDSAHVRAVSRDDLMREYEYFLEVESSGWKGRRGSSITQHEDWTAFHRGLIERVKLDGHCEIRSLHAEGRCIASEFCVYTRRQCAALKIGYDEAYAHVTPGRLLANKGFELCCDDASIDSVSEISNAPWLHMWLPEANGLRRAYVSLRPLSGGLLLAALRLRYGPVRRAVRAFKAWRRAHDDRRSVPGREAG